MDNRLIDPDVYRKIISGEKSLDINETVSLTFEDIGVTVYFKVSWCNVNECYIAEFTHPRGKHLTVDEISRAYVLEYFQRVFRIRIVKGMLTEEDAEDQAERMAFLAPQSV